MKIEYPKWLYSRTEKPRIVKDQAEHLALGPGWFESPADVAKGAPAAATSAPTDPPPAPVAPVTADPDAAVTQPSAEDAEAAALYKATVAAVVEKLKGSSEATLKHVQALEAQNPKGARSGVMKAIDAALAALVTA